MKKKVVVNLSINLYMVVEKPSDKMLDDVMDDIMANLDYDFSLIREGAEQAEIDDMEIVDWNARTEKA